MKYVPHGAGDAHAYNLKRGLAALGPEFCAFICWWCDGTTKHRFENCNVCGKGHGQMPLGLLTGDDKPAGGSVVNQVLVAAHRTEWTPCEVCTDPMDCASWTTCMSGRRA